MIAANPVLFGGIVLLCFMIALLIMRWWFKRIIDTKDCTITNQDSTIANLNSHIGILNTHLSHAKDQIVILNRESGSLDGKFLTLKIQSNTDVPREQLINTITSMTANVESIKNISDQLKITLGAEPGSNILTGSPATLEVRRGDGTKETR
jgi:hypothetical protein